MDFKEYQLKAERTIKSDVSQKDKDIYGALGMTGETGEIVELLKKMAYHGHSLDRPKMIEELGDALWYISYIATTHGLILDEIAKFNVDIKLMKRYPDGYSHEASINRKE